MHMLVSACLVPSDLGVQSLDEAWNARRRSFLSSDTEVGRKPPQGRSHWGGVIHIVLAK